MPLYEYKCKECGKRFETIHGVNVLWRNHYCSICKQWTRVVRLISRTSFVLKGLGWAGDGYSKNNKKEY